MKKLNELKNWHRHGYVFYVEYIENGVKCCDHWSEELLNEELKKNEVQIIFITLAYSVLVALGLEQE